MAITEVTIYQQKNHDEWCLVRVEKAIAVNRSRGEAIDLLLKLLDPTKEDAMRAAMNSGFYPWQNIDLLTRNILPAPSHLAHPAEASISLHQQNSEALANAASQPSQAQFHDKPFAIGPAILVSDQLLSMITRCKVCSLGVVNAFQQCCGRSSCPYTPPTSDDDQPF